MNNMKSILLGYKVVHYQWTGDTYLLESTNANFSTHVIEYTVGKWVSRPKHCGPLCVFEHLRDAMRFMGLSCKHEMIYSCEFYESDDTTVWFANLDGSFRTHAAPHYILPTGTILADSVRLLEAL